MLAQADSFPETQLAFCWSSAVLPAMERMAKRIRAHLAKFHSAIVEKDEASKYQKSCKSAVALMEALRVEFCLERASAKARGPKLKHKSLKQLRRRAWYLNSQLTTAKGQINKARASRTRTLEHYWAVRAALSDPASSVRFFVLEACLKNQRPPLAALQPTLLSIVVMY